MDENKNNNEILEERSKEKDGDESCQHSVKSCAVVKYSTVETPAHFAQLEFNTDLKLPPSNWLFSSTKNYGLHHPILKSNGFTSFRLAHMYSDCIGEVDVVSDAENIKKLLKIPYNKAPVSMMIHRIENTLLIDEFDIHKHLLIKAENDWQWLRKFFFENVIQSLPRHNFSLGHNYTRSSLQQKSLISKFLHYSFGEKETREQDGSEQAQVNLAPPVAPTHLIPSSGPVLPEPEVGEGLPGTANDYKFIRNVVWSFEDIQMLLGTDMPIFGGSTHPCISLRLRDIEKPISVLTGIDYWLDNLMSNVPEVIMCYHLDGIVQKYELIKTEDLPHLTDPKFSPELIRDVAQNILSFLKSNATKAGHTYWLFKGRDDDVVKLYDLSSICSESLVDKEQNPFTVPVGLLFYRVARNMKQSKDRPQPSTVRMLLKNCLALLPKEKYPQIVTSAHYMLSDIYIPGDINPCSPQFPDESNLDPDQPEEDQEDDITKTQVPIKSLCIANYITDRDTKYDHPPPLVGSVTERCISSLSHVGQGLDCLQYFSNIRSKKNDTKEEAKMANSSEPIPMPYTTLPDQNRNTTRTPFTEVSKQDNQQKSANALLCKANNEPVPTWQSADKMDSMSWRTHLESLLVKKACLIYHTLIEQYFSARRYGLCLHCISLYLELCKVGPMEIFNLSHLSVILKKAGDCCFHISKSWRNDDAYIAESDDNIPSLASFFKNESKGMFLNSDLLDINTEVTSIKETLLSSKNCYIKALKLLNQEDSSLLIRLGNVLNEIGSLYISQAYECFQAAVPSSEKSNDVEQSLLSAESELKEGIKIFEKLSDSKNIALLLSNMGKLNRVRALQHQESPQLFKQYIQKAEDNYLEALRVVGSRKEQPEIWDAVNWELSTFLFQLAFNHQDCQLPAKSLDEVSREVIELCQKCLKYCDLTTPERRLLLYQYRAARLHHMLASIFHRQYRTFGAEDSRRKMVLKLCQNHLLKATNLFQAADSYSDMLSVYLERISLLEFQASEVTSSSAKMKLFKSAICLFCELTTVLKSFLAGSDSVNHPDSESASDDSDKTEEIKLLTLEKIICSILKEIIVISMKSKTSSGNIAIYKEAYGLLLKKSSDDCLVNIFLRVIKLLSNTTDVKSNK